MLSKIIQKNKYITINLLIISYLIIILLFNASTMVSVDEWAHYYYSHFTLSAGVPSYLYYLLYSGTLFCGKNFYGCNYFLNIILIIIPLNIFIRHANITINDSLLIILFPGWYYVKTFTPEVMNLGMVILFFTFAFIKFNNKLVFLSALALSFIKIQSIIIGFTYYLLNKISIKSLKKLLIFISAYLIIIILIRFFGKSDYYLTSYSDFIQVPKINILFEIIKHIATYSLLINIFLPFNYFVNIKNRNPAYNYSIALLALTIILISVFTVYTNESQAITTLKIHTRYFEPVLLLILLNYLTTRETIVIPKLQAIVRITLALIFLFLFQNLPLSYFDSIEYTSIFLKTKVSVIYIFIFILFLALSTIRRTDYYKWYVLFAYLYIAIASNLQTSNDDVLKYKESISKIISTEGNVAVYSNSIVDNLRFLFYLNLPLGTHIETTNNSILNCASEFKYCIFYGESPECKYKPLTQGVVVICENRDYLLPGD